MSDLAFPKTTASNHNKIENDRSRPILSVRVIRVQTLILKSHRAESVAVRDLNVIRVYHIAKSFMIH